MSQRPTQLRKLDKLILNRIQEDIPFTQRPWQKVATDLGVKEDFLLERIAFLKKSGMIRRISAIFSPRKVNFVSTLVAVKISEDNIDKVAEKINSYPEVTHNYKRGAEYNLWFTLVARNKSRMAQILSRLKKDKRIEKISELPSVKLFKINVRLPA